MAQFAILVSQNQLRMANFANAMVSILIIEE